METRTHLTADLLLENGATVIQVSNANKQKLLIQLSDLKAISGLPLSKFEAFQLLRRASKFIDQTISISVADQRWLSCREGRLSIHNYFLTIKALFTS